MMGEYTDIFIDAPPLRDVLVLSKDKADQTMTNVPHLCCFHSPSGYSFGYGGSGPSDLALNVAEFFVREIDDGKTLRMDEALTVIAPKGYYHRAAWYVHQELKHKFIAGAKSGTEIPADDIRAFIMDELRKLS